MIVSHVPPATPAPTADVAAQRDEFPERRCGSGGGPVHCTELERGSGRIAAAPLPQCGAHDEDPKDCSREGRQDSSGAGGWVEMTIPYRVWVSGYQELHDDVTSEPIDRAFITDNLVLDVPSGGPFGFGEQAYINDWVALNLPGMDVMETKTLAAEFAEF